jgi:hypothetical protein
MCAHLPSSQIGTSLPTVPADCACWLCLLTAPGPQCALTCHPARLEQRQVDEHSQVNVGQLVSRHKLARAVLGLAAAAAAVAAV